MDVAAACSGFVYAYSVAQAHIVSGMARHVLVIGAEALTRFLDYTDRSTCILFGDGAGAVVLSASDQPGGSLGIQLTTDSPGAYMIWIPAGGAKAPPSAGTIGRREHFLRMEGKETYRFATKTMAANALASIERSGLRPSDIDLFIPHQANVRIVEAVAKGLGLPMEKMFVNVDRYGNTSAASIPIALAEAVETGRVRIGDHIVMVAFGAGFTSGAVTVQWTADPANAPPRRGDLPRRRAGPPAARLELGGPDPAGTRGRSWRRPGRSTCPLDDVVPGEPAHADRNRRTGTATEPIGVTGGRGAS